MVSTTNELAPFPSVLIMRKGLQRLIQDPVRQFLGAVFKNSYRLKTSNYFCKKLHRRSSVGLNIYGTSLSLKKCKSSQRSSQHFLRQWHGKILDPSLFIGKILTGFRCEWFKKSFNQTST